MTHSFDADVRTFKSKLANLPTYWDGKSSVLELKEAKFNWKQMEWIGFYFEFKVKQCLQSVCGIPGDKYDRVEFDLKKEINWDIKASAIKTDNHRIILNDMSAMNRSVKNYGHHGEIIGLCDVEYNDEDRSFQKWHTELKGGLSKYEKRRMAIPTSISRYRKSSARLIEIVYLVFSESDLRKLDVMRQGKNSNNKPRPPKYSLNLERIDDFLREKQQFTEI